MSDGDAIRRLRKTAGLSQLALSLQSGIPQGRISELESGKRVLSVRLAEQLERVFGDGRLLAAVTERHLEPFASRRVCPPSEVAEQWTDEFMGRLRDDKDAVLDAAAKADGYPF